MNSFKGKVIGHRVRGNGAYSSMAILINDNGYWVALLSGHTQPITQLADKLTSDHYFTIEGCVLSEWVMTRQHVGLLGIFEQEDDLPADLHNINCRSFDQFSVAVDDRAIEKYKTGLEIPIIVDPGDH